MKKILIIGLASLAGLMGSGAMAQVKLTADTLECHIIDFTFGAMMPGAGTASTGMTGGNTADLYKGPFLDFSLGCDYKYKSNWMVTLDGSIWFGYNSDNLKNRAERMGNVYAPGGYALSWGGYDGVVTAYNRSLAVRVGMAKILPVLNNNPNSGIMLGLKGGWVMQKTVFNQNYTESPVPQLNGDYAKLYDHLRNGAILTESIGFIFMSNLSTYVNFKIALELSECVTWSSRSYQIDNIMGLNGKDQNRYFDLIYGVRLTWMFPLMGKTTYDYYYY